MCVSDDEQLSLVLILKIHAFDIVLKSAFSFCDEQKGHSALKRLRNSV